MEVRWVQAVSNPRRPRRDVEEALRQNLLELVEAGRIEPGEADRRFERFLRRRGRASDVDALDGSDRLSLH